MQEPFELTGRLFFGIVIVYPVVGNNPINYIDPYGENAGVAIVGGIVVTCARSPQCTAGVAATGAAIGAAIEWLCKGQDAGTDPKAPGVPAPEDGYTAPKGWDGKTVPNPNGPGRGYPDKDGRVWVPTGPGGKAHGGPHWDVQRPGGGYTNVYPGGRTR